MEALWLRGRVAVDQRDWSTVAGSSIVLGFYQSPDIGKHVGQSSQAKINLYISTLQSQHGNTGGIYPLKQSSPITASRY